MSLLDLSILLILGWGLVSGLRKGLILQASTLLGFLAAVIATKHLSQTMAFYLDRMFEIPAEILPVVSIMLCFLAIIILCNFIAQVIHSFTHNLKLGWFDHLVGGVLGGLKYMLIIGFFAALIISHDKHEVIITQETQQNSTMLSPILKVTTLFLTWIDWDQTINRIQEQIERITVPLSELNTNV